MERDLDKALRCEFPKSNHTALWITDNGKLAHRKHRHAFAHLGAEGQSLRERRIEIGHRDIAHPRRGRVRRCGRKLHQTARRGALIAQEGVLHARTHVHDLSGPSKELRVKLGAARRIPCHKFIPADDSGRFVWLLLLFAHKSSKEVFKVSRYPLAQARLNQGDD